MPFHSRYTIQAVSEPSWMFSFVCCSGLDFVVVLCMWVFSVVIIVWFYTRIGFEWILWNRMNTSKAFSLNQLRFHIYPSTTLVQNCEILNNILIFQFNHSFLWSHEGPDRIVHFFSERTSETAKQNIDQQDSYSSFASESQIWIPIPCNHMKLYT